MKLGLQVSNFTGDPGPAQIGASFAEIARVADQAGLESLWVMDHLFQIRGIGPPEWEMLEGYSLLNFAAGITSQIKLGTMVTAVFYRYPGVLAKMVTTLDVLSGGRAYLGLGAGWNEDESRSLGIPFPPLKQRFEMLEETLQICLQMWAGDETPFNGTQYQLARPLNVPQSISRPHPRILVGGGGEKKTLRMVAQYADACNLFAGPAFTQKLAVLREHCDRLGRDISTIDITALFPLEDVGANGENANKVIEHLHEFAELGCQTAIVGVGNVHDVARVRALAEKVYPAVARFEARRAGATHTI